MHYNEVVDIAKSILIAITLKNLWACCEGQLQEGDPCTADDGLNGTCISLTNCPPALDLIEQRFSPSFCNPNTEVNFNALVCCNAGLRSGSLKQRISLEMCNKYFPWLAENLVYFAAVGGTKALARQYKHMALIGIGGKDDITWTCGGSLISENFVLTAAHCIINQLGAPEWIRLGELDTSISTDDADPEDFAVLRTIVHPAYQVPSAYHDIGLIELSTKVTFSDYIAPACLPQSKGDDIGYATATGWGATEFGGQYSPHLIEVYLNIVENERCNLFYRNRRVKQVSKGILEDFQICAGGNDGRDTCQGDSGGPLQVTRPGSKPGTPTFDIIGVTSFGIGCALGNTPGVYTRVFHYLDWIEKIVWPRVG